MTAEELPPSWPGLPYCIYRDPQVERISELERTVEALEAVIEQQARDYADLRSSYACFVEITLGLAAEAQRQ